MANMSYCRYENTSRDLGDCVEALWESDCGEDLSMYEIDGLKSLLSLSKEIVAMEYKINNILENNEQN